METVFRTTVQAKIRRNLGRNIIKDRRFLDDEQLIRSEQMALLEEIFNAKVRDPEIDELSSHFAGLFVNDHPCHLAVWGKTGTGKTLTVAHFLGLLAEMCDERKILFRHVHLDLSSPRPCFRALNDLACQLDACKYYKRGISLDEFMYRIEQRLADYRGYLVLFVDEADNVLRDRKTFFTFLIRRLPQRIPGKLILIFASNRLDWLDELDPRVKSFLKVNELVFRPYDAVDLQHILRIRVEKALHPGVVGAGVIEKVAALASRDHGNAREAVALLARAAYLAQRTSHSITLELVNQAADQIEHDRYLTMIRTSPPQLRAAMVAVIAVSRQQRQTAPLTKDAYDAYVDFCARIGMKGLTIRAFSDLLAELDLYSFLQSRTYSRGRYGRARELRLKMPEDLVEKIERTILLSFDLK